MKKLVSVLLISLLIMSTVVSTAAYSTDESRLAVEGAVQADENLDEIATNRYYFLMPDGTNGQKNPYENDAENYGKYVASWYNEYTDTPAIYFWNENSIFFPDDNSASNTSVIKGDSDCVFYADVPKSDTAIVWSNNVEYSGASDPMFAYARYTVSIPCEYYDAGESDIYPDGVDGFDNMIYVLHAPTSSTDRLPSSSNEFIGEWYYYYGDGCYGTVENGTVDNCIRDDHEHHSESKYLYKQKFADFIHNPEYNPQIHTDIHETFFDYDELYYHKNGDSGETDWALITAKVHNLVPWEKVEAIRIGSRVIRYWSSGAYILPYALVVYDASEDTFKCISEVDFDDYAGLVEAVEQLELGLAVGDVDMDGVVSILDATEIQRYLAKLKDLDIVLSRYITTLADVQVDGKMSIIDATAIQRKLAKLDVVDTGKFVFYKQDKNASFGDIPDVSGDAVRIEFTSEYELGQFSNIMYDYEVVGDYCTYAIIKSNEQYNMLFNDNAPKFDDEFFERKSLVVSIVLCSDLLTEAPITKLGIVDDTLFVSAFPYRTNPELPAPEAMQMWLSIVSVDKEQVADVSNIIYGRM